MVAMSTSWDCLQVSVALHVQQVFLEELFFWPKVALSISHCRLGALHMKYFPCSSSHIDSSVSTPLDLDVDLAVTSQKAA